jgi:uncharacterized coiled-coil protein SlyX
MAKELDLIQELAKRLKSLEDRIKALEGEQSFHKKTLREYNTQLVHLRKSSKKNSPLK